MPSGAQDDSSQQPAARRRNSLGRALERFRTVFTRRGSNKAGPTTTTTTTKSDTPVAQPTVPGPAVEDAGIAPVAPTGPPAEAFIALDNPLEVDENAIDDFDDTEEPIIPVEAGSSRTGISEERAKALFERYGLKYTATKRQDPPSKIRRVERPVRIRLRWSCHECNASFSNDKVCQSCGHGRCGDCTRAPPQRVLRILEKTKREKEAAEIRLRAASASPDEDAVSGPSATLLAEKIPGDLTAPETPSTSLPLMEKPRTQAEPLKFVYTIRSGSLGGAGGVELYHMLPRTSSYGKPDVTSPSLQRVFKQPRQRIRWTCDRCDAVFAARDRCSTCHHEKCGDCIRSPPKRDSNSIDPAVLRSVEARLAGHDTGYQSPLVAV